MDESLWVDVPVDRAEYILADARDIETVWCPMSELNTHQAFLARLDGVRWEDTEYYKHYTERIRAGEVLWECHSESDFQTRCYRDIDRLLWGMQHKGYRFGDTAWGRDEPAIRIDAEGHLQVVNGQHRLTAAHVLGLEQIPIRVTSRHRDWCAFRQRVLDYATGYGRALVYAPILHADLARLPALYPIERTRAIATYVPAGSSVLELGSHWGHLSQYLERTKQCKCVAVDSDPEAMAFARVLRTAMRGEYALWEQSMFDLKSVEADIILIPNVLHHFLKTEGGLAQLSAWLPRLQCKRLILQVHAEGEFQMVGAAHPWTPSYFINWICQNLSWPSSFICRELYQQPRPLYIIDRVFA